MKSKSALIMVLIAFILQPFISGLLPEVIVPNLAFCLLVILALMMESDGVLFPVILTLALTFPIDFYSNQFVGVNAIAMIVVFVLLMLVKPHINLDNILLTVLTVVGANILYEFVYWFVYRIMGSTFSITYMLVRMPGSIIANAAVLVLAIFILSKRALEIRRENYFKARKW